MVLTPRKRCRTKRAACRGGGGVGIVWRTVGNTINEECVKIGCVHMRKTRRGKRRDDDDGGY